jgi:hypothetical protein
VELANHSVSDQLRAFMATFPDEVEVFATDKHGLVVAMTERTGDYLQADESWWEQAFNNGRGDIYIGQVEYDDSSQIWAINIAVPIKDSEQVVGVLRGTVDISSVFEILSQLKVGQTGQATLLDKNGVVIYTPNIEQRFQPAPESLIAAVDSAPAGFDSTLTDMAGNPAVVAFNHLDGQMAELLGWAIVLEQDIAEVEGPVRQLFLGNLLVAGVIIVVLGGAGVLVARSIAAPLRLVTQQAQQLAGGDTTAESSARSRPISSRG